ncbi:MAG: hypothetical protein Q7T45_15440, partial [Bradyrhizobium sp.]|uniref:hypothetical protein n=1 Tax=Bradyrhizobium sp. TaxID=376 RepID=UPI002719B53E
MVNLPHGRESKLFVAASQVRSCALKRAELRRAFDRIGFLGNQTTEDQAGEGNALLADRDTALGETHFIAP